MNRLYYLLFFVFPIHLTAQAPVLTFDKFYQEGQNYTYLLVADTLKSRQDTIKGAGTIWDFSHLNYAKTKNSVYTHSLVKSLIKNEEVSNVEVPELTDLILKTALYSDILEDANLEFLQLQSGSVQLLIPNENRFRWGNYSIDIQGELLDNKNTIDYFFDNFSYGEEKKDSVIITYDTLLENRLKQTKIIQQLKYDGYGRMQLPISGTLNEVVKLQQRQIIEYQYQTSKGDSLFKTETLNYFWFAKGYPGEIISGNKDSYYFRPPFYFNNPFQKKEIKTNSCNEMVTIELEVDRPVNNCSETGIEMTIQIDLFSDGVIDTLRSISVAKFDFSFPLGRHTYSMGAKNRCGETANKTILINVIDQGSIEAICQEEQVVFFEQQVDNTYTANLSAQALDNGSFSNCNKEDSLIFRLYHPSLVTDFFPHSGSLGEEISTKLPTALTFDCSLLSNPVPTYVGFYAINPAGSWKECISKIVLIDTMDYCSIDSTLSKICVTQLDNTPVSNVTISWGGGFSSKAESVYQQGCVYIKSDTSKRINLIKPDEFDLGISTFDLLLIQKHILGITPFENEAQLLAADINNTGTITSKDLLDLRKFIIGSTNFFPGNTGWRFFPKYWLEKGFDWKALQIGHHLMFDPKEFEGRPYEFIAIKVGDVSGVLSK